jgi:hypothetical protein
MLYILCHVLQDGEDKKEEKLPWIHGKENDPYKKYKHTKYGGKYGKEDKKEEEEEKNYFKEEKEEEKPSKPEEVSHDDMSAGFWVSASVTAGFDSSIMIVWDAQA